MLLKTTSCIALFVFLGAGLMAQETIDVRLLKNRGKQAEMAFIHNRNSYNYYLFELDKSHYMVPVSELTTEEQVQLLTADSFRNAAGEPITFAAATAPAFNFYDYGIQLKKEQRIYIALDGNQTIVFYAIPELTQLFRNSEFNTK